MLIKRQIAEIISKNKKSLLLLGPRQTGKSTLIRELKPEQEVDLADEQTYIEFLRDPGLLKKRIVGCQSIFIDEIQRIPSLLNTVQSLLDHNKGLQFFLTGSSARKLKRGQANLLPGRIVSYELGPLSLTEIGSDTSIDRLLSLGALPGIFVETNEALARKILRSYAATYLKEEIQAEALTRNLEGFSRFFDIAASRSGDFIDLSKVASLAMIERMSARRYFDILVDTLVVYPIQSFAKSAKRRLIQHPKFYFFDTGVLNGCLSNFEVSADRKGNLFEHLCLQMILSEAKGRDEDIRVTVYRTEAGAEVDFIVERNRQRPIAIEVKATSMITKHHLRGLKSFSDFYGKNADLIIIYLGEHELAMEGVRVLPFSKCIEAIF